MSSKALARLDIFDAQSGMLTQAQLADMLADVRVEDVAREAGVSTKTVYRLRHQRHAPTLTTVNAILAALERIKADESQAAEAA